MESTRVFLSHRDLFSQQCYNDPFFQIKMLLFQGYSKGEKNLNLSPVKESNLIIEIILSVSFIVNGKNLVLFCMFHILINAIFQLYEIC